MIEVLVSEGDVVKQIHLLIRLQDDELKILVAQAQAALDLAKANLTQIEQGAPGANIYRIFTIPSREPHTVGLK